MDWSVALAGCRVRELTNQLLALLGEQGGNLAGHVFNVWTHARKP